jgi:hypothetical protein
VVQVGVGFQYFAEVGAGHIPVRLLALEMQFDEVDEDLLQVRGQRC